MQDLTVDLHKMGEDEVVDIFKVKRTSSDIFDRILHLFYIKRHPLSIGQICEDLDVDYPITHKVISKLVHIGILSIEEGEKTGNQFILSQKGIDFYLNYSTLELDNKIIEIISKKHSIFVLRLLKSKDFSWTDLRNKMKISESSLKGVIDDLSKTNLIDKMKGKYSLSNKGLSVLDAVNNLCEIKFTPAFEVQIKILIMDNKIYKKLEKIEGLIKKEQVKQSDHYFIPHETISEKKTYLRLRTDVPISSSSLRTLPVHNLTWTNVINRKKYDNLWIIGRQKEEIDVRYPAIIFYLDYLGAKVHKKIVKKRMKMEIPSKQIIINVDEIEEPKKDGIFLEVKTNAWDEMEAKNKATLVQEIIKEIGLDEIKSIDKTYYELI